MVRYRSWITTGLVVLGLVVLFAVFIAFRRNADLIAAMEAAGTVAAAGFAALAGVAAMRAANESSATARRARETQARTARPLLSPRLEVVDGRLRGVVRSSGGPPAVDVTVAWLRADGETVTSEAAEIAPGADGASADLGPFEAAGSAGGGSAGGGSGGAGSAGGAAGGEPAAALKMVWLEYGDEGGVGQWQDTWQVADRRLVRSASDLVD